MHKTLSHAKIKYRIIMMERESNHQRFQKDNGIKRILVVDDESDISLTIKVVLEETASKLIHLLVLLRPYKILGMVYTTLLYLML